MELLLRLVHFLIIKKRSSSIIIEMDLTSKYKTAMIEECTIYQQKISFLCVVNRLFNSYIKKVNKEIHVNIFSIMREYWFLKQWNYCFWN